MDVLTRQKWDRAARGYDFMNGYGQELRWAPFKRRLFDRMRGRIIFASIGTGQDIQFFPPGRDITGIDISAGMLQRARPRAAAYPGRLALRQIDVLELDYPDGSFDQAFTACTFCSVPRPVDGLRMLRRVLKPGGELFMFEHTGSRYFPFSLMLNLMSRRIRGRGRRTGLPRCRQDDPRRRAGRCRNAVAARGETPRRTETGQAGCMARRMQRGFCRGLLC